MKPAALATVRSVSLSPTNRQRPAGTPARRRARSKKAGSDLSRSSTELKSSSSSWKRSRRPASSRRSRMDCAVSVPVLDMTPSATPGPAKPSRTSGTNGYTSRALSRPPVTTGLASVSPMSKKTARGSPTGAPPHVPPRARPVAGAPLIESAGPPPDTSERARPCAMVWRQGPEGNRSSTIRAGERRGGRHGQDRAGARGRRHLPERRPGTGGRGGRTGGAGLPHHLDHRRAAGRARPPGPGGAGDRAGAGGARDPRGRALRLRRRGRAVRRDGGGAPGTVRRRAGRGARPIATLNAYLDRLDAAGVPAERRVLAALGPRMFDLARDRAAGALPVHVTPEYVARARGRLGDGCALAVEQLVVLDSDAARAR